MKRRYIAFAIAMVLLITVVVVRYLWFDMSTSELYIYPMMDGEKTYTIDVVTDFGSKPQVSLSNVSLGGHNVELYFLGGTSKSVFFNITIHRDLLGGNISVVQKYYELPSDQYTVSSNSTHNSVEMSFDYDPDLSGVGYFLIRGSEGTW